MSSYEKMIDIFLQNPNFTQRKIAKFSGFSLSSVEKAIRKYELNLPCVKKPKPRRKKGPADPALEKRVVEMIELGINDSIRDLARKCKTSKSNIQRIKTRNGYNTCTKQIESTNGQKGKRELSTIKKKIEEKMQ